MRFFCQPPAELIFFLNLHFEAVGNHIFCPWPNTFFCKSLVYLFCKSTEKTVLSFSLVNMEMSKFYIPVTGELSSTNRTIASRTSGSRGEEIMLWFDLHTAVAASHPKDTFCFSNTSPL